MKLEDLVLSIEQAKHLQELGLDMSDAALYWCSVSHDWKGKEIKDRKWHVVVGNSYQSVGMMRYESIPTYTFQEMWNKLPLVIIFMGIRYELRLKRFVYTPTIEDVKQMRIPKKIQNTVLYEKEDDVSDWCIMQSYADPLESAYEILCWVIKNGYLKVEKKTTNDIQRN